MYQPHFILPPIRKVHVGTLCLPVSLEDQTVVLISYHAPSISDTQPNFSPSHIDIIGNEGSFLHVHLTKVLLLTSTCMESKEKI
jgi:hypothetical protein